MGSMAAAAAGMSTATTTTSNNTKVSGNYKGESAAVGAVANNRGYAAVGGAVGAYAGSSNVNVSNKGTSSTTNYDGSAAFVAGKIQQQEQRANKEERQNIRNELYEGYIKSSTVQPQKSASGYFMIKQEKADKMIIKIPINGVTYETEWNLVEKKK